MKIEIDVYTKERHQIIHETIDDFDILMLMQRRVADRGENLIVESIQIARIEP